MTYANAEKASDTNEIQGGRMIRDAYLNQGDFGRAKALNRELEQMEHDYLYKYKHSCPRV